MNVQTNPVPLLKRRITKGDWKYIRIEYNAENCANRSINSLQAAYNRDDMRVIAAVTRFYKTKNAEIRRILTEAQEAGIITEEQA